MRDGGSLVGFVKGDRWVPLFDSDSLMRDWHLPRPHRRNASRSRLLLSCGAMTVGHFLLAATSTLFVLTLSVRATTAPQSPAARQPVSTHVPTLPATTAADYMGSKACARCHQEDVRSVAAVIAYPHDQTD